MSVISYPFTIGWGITNRCNFNCKHCNMDSGKAYEDELSFDEACKLIDEFALYNVKNICFTGGEPLSRPDFFDICEYAIEKGIYVCLTSNGSLITDEIINKHLYKFQLVRISIDGVDAEQHDSFRNKRGAYYKAMSSIKLMLKSGCNVGVVTCVSKLNFPQLEKIASKISSIGIKKWFLPLLSPSGRGKHIQDLALEPFEVKDFIIKISTFKEKYGLQIGVDIPYAVLLNEISTKNKSFIYGNCAAGYTQVMIFPNGDISPCFAMKMKCGNVRTDNLSDIWLHNDVFVNFRNKSLLQGKCGSCEYLTRCGGGCRAVPFITENNYLGEDTVCWK
ncbi:MAG: radical SAM protein [Ruminococcus sp.]|nr:radical SAM protein [Ruminococcus sp.]